VSVIEVIDSVRRVLGISVEPHIAPRRPGDTARIVADGTGARDDLGWTPTRDLEDMVRDAWRAWRSALAS